MAQGPFERAQEDAGQEQRPGERDEETRRKPHTTLAVLIQTSWAKLGRGGRKDREKVLCSAEGVQRSVYLISP